jgi:hypothetical protein
MHHMRHNPSHLYHAGKGRFNQHIQNMNIQTKSQYDLICTKVLEYFIFVGAQRLSCIAATASTVGTLADGL